METKVLNEIVLDFLTKTTGEVLKMSEKGEGKEVLGQVRGRPEDLEIGIDRVGEKVLKELLTAQKISCRILSENGDSDVGKGPHEVFASVDPFDNTILFFTGFKHTWYTALTFYDTQKKPLCVGIGDILNKRAWIFDGKETFLLDLNTSVKRPTVPHRHTRLEGPISIASYLMSSQYSTKFLHHFWHMIKHMDPKSLLYPFGGSHIYGYLADGRIDAYVMFDEPRTEIDPGFSLAKAAGCEVVEVDKKGDWRNYKFIPERHEENVPLLIAACTKELRDKLIEVYKNSLRK